MPTTCQAMESKDNRNCYIYQNKAYFSKVGKVGVTISCATCDELGTE